MAKHELSRAQRLITRLVDAPTAAAIEAHSRAWLVRCLACGHRRSIWELGGVRYKATGNSLTRLSCPACGKTGAHRLEKADDFPVTHVSSWSLVRAILLLTLAAMVVLGALIGGLVALILWMTGTI